MTLQEKFKTCFNELTPEYTRIKLNKERIWNCRQERIKLEEDLKVVTCTLLDVNCKKINELNNKIKFYALQINGCIGIIVGNIRGLLVSNGYDITTYMPVAWNIVQDVKTLVDRKGISEKKFRDGLKYITDKWKQSD